MPKRKRLKRKRKTHTYTFGFPPYLRIKSKNGFELKQTGLFPVFGAKITMMNGRDIPSRK